MHPTEPTTGPDAPSICLTPHPEGIAVATDAAQCINSEGAGGDICAAFDFDPTPGEGDRGRRRAYDAREQVLEQPEHDVNDRQGGGHRAARLGCSSSCRTLGGSTMPRVLASASAASSSAAPYCRPQGSDHHEVRRHPRAR